MGERPPNLQPGDTFTLDEAPVVRMVLVDVYADGNAKGRISLPGGVVGVLKFRTHRIYEFWRPTSKQ